MPQAVINPQLNVLFQVMLNNMDDSLMMVDQQLNILFYNESARRQMLRFKGFAPPPGTPFHQLIPTEKQNNILDKCREVLLGSSFRDEVCFTVDADEPVFLLNSFTPARDQNGEILGICILSKDVTRERCREDELRRSNERFELIAKATSDATWDYDIVNHQVYFNESFTRYFGHELRNGMNGYQVWEKHIFPEDRQRVVTKMQAVISDSSQQQWEDEYRFIMDDGSVAYVYDRGLILRDEAGRPVRMIGSMQDVTRQRKNEMQLAMSEHRFRSLVQTGNDLIGIIDPQGRYLYVSPSVEQLGYTADALLGRLAFDYIHPEDLPAVQQSLEAVMTHRQVTTPPFRFRNAAGEWRWIVSVAADFVDDPVINGVVVNSRDITEQKKKDEALQKAVNDLNKILDSSVDVIVVTDAAHRYIEVSAAARKIWGYDPAELIGRPCFDLVHPDDRAITQQVSEQVMRGAQITNFQNRYIRKDGTVVPLIWSARWDDAEQVMYTVARDATEQVAAEQALHKSEENYRQLFESNPLPMFAFDIQTLEFIMVNTAASEFYGYSKEEFSRLTILDIRPPSEREKFLQLMEEVKDETGIRRKCGWKHLKKDGAVVEVDSVGHNFLIDGRQCRLAVIHDVTERNKAREALQKSESMFRAISESFPNGIVCIINRNLEFEYVAGKELEDLGIPPSFFLGKSYREHFPDDELTIQAGAEQVFAGEAMVSEIRFMNRNYLLSSVPLPEADGSIQRILVVSQNITTQKRIQKEKELLIGELTRNVNDLRQFSYITSHNLRAPISNLIGIMNLINPEAIRDTETAFMVEKFKESTMILNETVNDLLSILLIKNNVNVERERLSLSHVWQQVCTSVSSQLEKSGASVTSDFSAESEVLFNKSYAESILLNLLTNSIKYRSPERPLQISITTTIETEHVVLRFCDNGIGINLDYHRDKIFGLYQRFHDYPDSKGLGLYIVHSQVTALGGKIEVDSTVGKGTCFKIYFKR